MMTMVAVIIRVSYKYQMGSSPPCFAPSGSFVSNSYLIASNSYLMAPDSTPVACTKSFGAQFIESAGNDCFKSQTDFDEVFAESFPNVGKSQSKNNVEPKDKEVADMELNENNETIFGDSHFEIMDTDNQFATQLSPLSWNANQIILDVFTKVMKDLMINLDDFNVFVMHYVCWYL